LAYDVLALVSPVRIRIRAGIRGPLRIALKADLALFTVYPSLGVVLLGTHHAKDVADPAMGFVVPAMYWYGWTATAALGALMFGLIGASLPEVWTNGSGRDGCGLSPWLRCLRAFTSQCLGFGFSQASD
jgi:hypothetical protein